MCDKQDDYPDLEPYEDEYSSHLKRVHWWANFLDTRFNLPGTTIKFGWDGLIGLLPGIGDTLALIPQAFLVYEAVKLKLGAKTLLLMIANVILDWLIGLIPVLGDFFDVAFKSGLRNAKIVEKAIKEKRMAS